jgi:hypothetical protein
MNVTARTEIVERAKRLDRGFTLGSIEEPQSAGLPGRQLHV